MAIKKQNTLLIAMVSAFFLTPYTIYSMKTRYPYIIKNNEEPQTKKQRIDNNYQYEKDIKNK